MTYQLTHATVSRAGKVVLEDLSLQLPRGNIIGLIGPNGAGKSTLLGLLAGDLELDQGQVSLDGAVVADQSVEQLARQRAIMVQQPPAVFNLTVMQVLELGLHAFAAWPGDDRLELLKEVAQAAEIDQWLDRSITTLSIGQQQRVNFARTLLQAKAAHRDHGRAWLLLDEPTANQDPRHQQLMMSVCHEFASLPGVGVLAVMHDLTLAAQWCDEMLVVKDKGMLAQGKTPDVLTPQTLKIAFGVELDVQVLWQPMAGVIISRYKHP